MAGQITGVVGQIKWAYYVAASINGYTVTRTPTNEWSVRGTVVLSDAFKLAQRPLFFVAPHEKGEWRWPVRRIHFVEPNQLVAELDPPAL